MQAQAQSKAADYNSQMEKYNAQIQNQQGQVDAANIEQQGEMIQGKARAAAAASGLMGGSSTDIQYNDLVQNDKAALAIRYRGQIGAYNAENQSTLDSMQASSAQTAGMIGGGSALLSGLGKAAGQYQSSFGQPSVQPVFGSTTDTAQPTF